MRAVDIIVRKRDRYELTKEEIETFIEGFTKGWIPDYQAAAWAMAVLLNGMTPRETADLTMAMVHSGDVLDLSEVVPIAVDKHSTGGVGDKTTLVILPVVAACGLPVGKMSGHGLAFTGGTLDKMESIPGYRCDLNTEEFLHQLQTIGLVLTGQTADLAPADGKLYALRDVTGTVQSIPLIASSVMSKKIAAGANGILLDVKWGVGAFMRTLEEAHDLAELMVSIAHQVGREAIAILSDMNQPLGCAVGNSIELREAIDTLRGGGPTDFREHCIILAGYMLALGNVTPDERTGRQMAQKALEDGRGLERFIQLVSAQGGDPDYVMHPERLPIAPFRETVTAPRDGYLSEINARVVGETAMHMGAGREKKGDVIDHSVGIEILHKVGDYVESGSPIFIIHARTEDMLNVAHHRLLKAHSWSEDPVEPLPNIYGVVK